MHIVILGVFSIMLLMTGCTVQPDCTSSDSKRVIYQSVKDTVRDTLIEGDYLFNKAYFLEAMNAYDSVNFYESRYIISLNRIKKIKRRANANGKYYYDKALKNKKNKKKVLEQLNRVFRNVESYKNSKELFEELKKDPKIILFLTSLEKLLKEALEKNKSLKEISNALEKIAKYDDSNPVVIEAKNHIKTECRILIHDGVELYNAKRNDESIHKFNAVKTIYQDSEVINQYIKTINRLKTSKTSKRLKISKISKKSKTSKKAYKDIVSNLIKKGKGYYDKQNFENAKKAFSKVLKYEPDNNTSKTYLQKITRQLKTIEQLR